MYPGLIGRLLAQPKLLPGGSGRRGEGPRPCATVAASRRRHRAGEKPSLPLLLLVLSKPVCLKLSCVESPVSLQGPSVDVDSRCYLRECKILTLCPHRKCVRHGQQLLVTQRRPANGLQTSTLHLIPWHGAQQSCRYMKLGDTRLVSRAAGNINVIPISGGGRGRESGLERGVPVSPLPGERRPCLSARHHRRRCFSEMAVPPIRGFPACSVRCPTAAARARQTALCELCGSGRAKGPPLCIQWGVRLQRSRFFLSTGRQRPGCCALQTLPRATLA